LEREAAIALLKEIIAEQAAIPIWVDLEQAKSDLYELHIKPLCVDPDSLKRIVEKHNLTFKEAKGFLVICNEHNKLPIAVNC
jgi:hypothetical protein